MIKSTLDAAELDKWVRACGKSKVYLSARLGISRQAFDKKLNGEVEFRANEAIVLAEQIGIGTWADFRRIFFAKNGI